MSLRDQLKNIQVDDLFAHAAAGIAGAIAGTLIGIPPGFIVTVVGIFWFGRELHQSGSWMAWQSWSLKKWLEALIPLVACILTLLFIVS